MASVTDTGHLRGPAQVQQRGLGRRSGRPGRGDAHTGRTFTVVSWIILVVSRSLAHPEPLGDQDLADLERDPRSVPGRFSRTGA